MSTGPVSAGTRLPDAVLRPVRAGNAFEATVEQLATRDPARACSRRRAAAAGARARRAARRLAGRRCARRSAALREAGLVTTRRGRGGGTVVTSAGRGTPVGPRPRGPSADAAPATGWTPWTSGASSSRGRPSWPPTPALAARPAGLARRVAARGGRARPRRRPRTGMADSRLHLPIAALTGLADARRGRDPGAGRAARDARGDPGAATPTSPTPTTSTTPSCAAILAGDADRGPGRDGGALRRTPRCCADCWAERHEPDRHGERRCTATTRT